MRSSVRYCNNVAFVTFKKSVTKPNPVPDIPGTSHGVDLTTRLDEQVLVERVRAGDPLAFEAIFRCYHAELCAVAEYVVGSRAGAEDVVQEVFLRIWTLRQRWNVSVSVHAYLRRAVRNVALRHVSPASARRHEPLPSESDPDRTLPGQVLVDPGASPAANAEAAILAEDLAQAVAVLPHRTREVYRLSRDNGLSTKEIAERLGISPKTVEIYMTRALTVLRARAARWRER